MILLKKFLIFFKNNYQKEWKIIKGSDFVFESVDILDYKLRVRLKRGGAYIKSPKWLENKNNKSNNKPKIWKWWWMFTMVNNLCFKL